MATLHIVAGPNGCGKSTLTRTNWFGDVDIIDPDEIARGMMAGNPGQAAREALHRRRDALAAKRSHLVETTLAGSGPLRHMTDARRAGHRIVLHYVSVGSPDAALDRIRNRVTLGGHDIPQADVRRRFVRSHVNLPTAMALADMALLYDNSDPDWPHREVAIMKDGGRWVARSVPGWAEAALALPHRR